MWERVRDISLSQLCLGEMREGQLLTTNQVSIEPGLLHIESQAASCPLVAFWFSSTSPSPFGEARGWQPDEAAAALSINLLTSLPHSSLHGNGGYCCLPGPIYSPQQSPSTPPVTITLAWYWQSAQQMWKMSFHSPQEVGGGLYRHYFSYLCVGGGWVWQG